MDAKLMKIFAFLLLFCLCNRGSAQHCKLSDLAIAQSAFPSGSKSYTTYTVTVENRCICSQENIKLSCQGFRSFLGLNTDVLSIDSDGKLCTLNSGRPIGMGPEYAIYAWGSEFGFKPVSSTIACS